MTLDPRTLPDSVARTVSAYGADHDGVRRAHAGFALRLTGPGRQPIMREQREEAEEAVLAPGATRARAAGRRAEEEEPDPVRTCFERDLDRIRHSPALRALAGKQQVFLDADGGLRNRLTHSTEVAQIAEAIANAVGANSTLCHAAGLAHDTGHTPCGHDGETAFDAYWPGGFDHATFGADVVLVKHNLCVETLDAVRQHSWRLGPPNTPEGEIVSWADRIAYTTSDFQDAVSCGVLRPDQLPDIVRATLGERASAQIHTLISALITSTLETGIVGMDSATAQALDTFRAFNYENIYLRPAARAQAEKAKRLLCGLVEYFADRPARIVGPHQTVPAAGSAEAAMLAIEHVAAMTDRGVLEHGAYTLGLAHSALPRGA